MAALSVDSGLEPGLPIEAIEERLVVAAKRHHLEERNMAYWLHEIDKRLLYQERGFSSIGDYARELIEITPRKAQYLVFIAIDSRASRSSLRRSIPEISRGRRPGRSSGWQHLTRSRSGSKKPGRLRIATSRRR